jgi:hypothetical protein
LAQPLKRPTTQSAPCWSGMPLPPSASDTGPHLSTLSSSSGRKSWASTAAPRSPPISARP